MMASGEQRVAGGAIFATGCVLLSLFVAQSEYGWTGRRESNLLQLQGGLTGLQPVPGVQFPDEGFSPMAGVDGVARYQARELKRKIMDLGRFANKDPRGGLRDTTRGQGAPAEGSDSVVCAIPVVSDLVSVFGARLCRGRHASEVNLPPRPGVRWRHAGSFELPGDAAQPGASVQSRATMGVSRTAHEREVEEGARLRRAADAVYAAESKMGNFYDEPVRLHQPRDRIVPAIGGESQHDSWRRFVRVWRHLFGGSLSSPMLKFPHWGKPQCRADDPACGSTLTLHDPRVRWKQRRMGDVYSFPAGPPVAVPQFPGGARAPCTDPACGATLSVGAPRARARDADVEARSPLAGSRIPDRSAPGGARVRCADPADPSCGGTLTLHAPRVAARERRGDTFSFVAGRRIGPQNGPLGAPVFPARRRRVVPLPPPEWGEAARGAAESARGAAEHVRGAWPPEERLPADTPQPRVHRRAAGKKHDPLLPYGGRIEFPWDEDAHLRGRDVRPWRYKAVHGGTLLRRIPCKGAHCPQTQRGISGSAPGGTEERKREWVDRAEQGNAGSSVEQRGGPRGHEAGARAGGASPSASWEWVRDWAARGLERGRKVDSAAI